jgi:hypothetical protein
VDGGSDAGVTPPVEESSGCCSTVGGGSKNASLAFLATLLAICALRDRRRR